MTPLLFLDIDGVLNCHRYLSSLSKPWPVEDAMMLDPARIGRLNRIISATGARVVLSSSWRWAHTTEAMHEMLVSRGYTGLPLIGATPTDGKHMGIRGHEIRAWLHEEGYEGRFVILDDSSDAGVTFTKGRFVQTHQGLDDEHVERAVKILAGGDVRPDWLSGHETLVYGKARTHLWLGRRPR